MTKRNQTPKALLAALQAAKAKHPTMRITVDNDDWYAYADNPKDPDDPIEVVKASNFLHGDTGPEVLAVALLQALGFDAEQP